MKPAGRAEAVMGPQPGPRSTGVAESRLGNGVRVLTETLPGVRSVAVGVWVRQGSVHETPESMGASHLLEHLVFKGTENRGPREIALALEGLGGSLDAYTSREHTSFQARALDAHLDEALDVLADLVLRPRLRPQDFELEREVVLEEIAAVEDTPDDLVFDLHGSGLWAGHPYGYPILGTPDTIRSLDAKMLAEIHAGRYVGANVLVAGAGNVQHDDFVDRVDRLFGGMPAGARSTRPEAPGDSPAGTERVDRASAQTHVVMGARVPGHSDPRRYPLVLLSAALGGGMSSRLFQRIREELALAYTVYSFQSYYRDAGVAGVYVGTRPGGGDRAIEAIGEELSTVAGQGLPTEELERTKRQVQGQITLSLESTSARLYRLAGFALNDEPFLSLNEILDRIEAVTEEQVRSIAAQFFRPDHQFITRLGPEGGA